MRHVLAVVLLGVTAPAWSQDPKDSKALDRPASYDVTLAPGDPTSKLAPVYSPIGRPLNLEPRARPELAGFDHLEAHLTLGPSAETREDHLLVLARSEKGKPYDLLFVDVDGTGKLSEMPVKVVPKLIRNKTWSSFDALVRVNHPSPDGSSGRENYPIALWAVVEEEGETPDVIRMSRRGFLSGSVRLGETAADVILSDSNNDGVVGRGDWWELREQGSTARAMRVVGDFAWAGGKAWKLEPSGTNGRKAKVVAFNPGLTEVEDSIKRDLYREDRLAARAEKPVAFRKDVDAALKEAADKKAPYFLKFETDWCGPCKLMTQFVFTAKDVADASIKLTCIVIDGDARQDLAEKYDVGAYPTGILFSANGDEIARYIGYQTVKETAAFLKKR